jgi:hypothetical protein
MFKKASKTFLELYDFSLFQIEKFIFKNTRYENNNFLSNLKKRLKKFKLISRSDMDLLYYHYNRNFTEENIHSISMNLLKKFYQTFKNFDIEQIKEISSEQFRKELKDYFEMTERNKEIIILEHVNHLNCEILNINIQTNDFSSHESRNGTITIETKLEYLHKYFIKNQENKLIDGSENEVQKVFVNLNFEKTYQDVDVNRPSSSNHEEFENGWKMIPPAPIYFVDSQNKASVH